VKKIKKMQIDFLAFALDNHANYYC